MNNIEILEELKEFLLSTNHEPQFNINQYTSAIENLIKENKELREMLQRRLKYISELEADLFENSSHYVIQKTKVTKILYHEISNRIEELEKENKDLENDIKLNILKDIKNKIFRMMYMEELLFPFDF